MSVRRKGAVGDRGHPEASESRASIIPNVVAILGSFKVTKPTLLDCSHFSDAFSKCLLLFHIVWALKFTQQTFSPQPNQKAFMQAILQNTKSGERKLNQTQIKSSDRRLQQSPHRNQTCFQTKILT